MKVVTAREMQEIDRFTIKEMGIPGDVLMGLAGKSVADYITDNFPDARRVAVVSGTGNNGGDGFVAAYFLHNRGVRADLFLAGDPGKISQTSRIYYDLCARAGLIVTERASVRDFADTALDRYDLVVDALLGTGFSGTVRGEMREIIQAINDADVPVVSIDMPSGLASDGPLSGGEAVIADCTVTIGLPKISLVTYPGKNFTGRLHVADIGFPADRIRSDCIKTELIDDEYAASGSIREIEAEFRSRADTNKSERGHLLLIGGFDGMEGAIIMTASAALETGVGLVSLITTPSARSVIAGRLPECMTVTLPYHEGIDTVDQATLSAALIDVFESKRYDTLVIGPGMGRSTFARNIYDAVIQNINRSGIRRMLIDGDGLSHLADMAGEVKFSPGPEVVVTPHFKEASRLMGVSVPDIMGDRHGAAGALARKLNCTVLLKGPATIVTDGDRFFINSTGTSALATAGSGDVLSGIIGSLLLRRFTTVQAAAFGAYIHGKAADIHCRKAGIDLLKATDIINRIRGALSSS